MNHTIPCLQTEAIESLLAGQLTPEELTTVEEHLTGCGTCRQRIERTIGVPGWWQEACQALASRDGVDLEIGSSPKTTRSGSSTDRLLSVLGPSDDPRMLGRIGSYEVVGLIGRGGMGIVFKGFDTALNRYVAIKMLLPDLASSGAARKRFSREARAAAAVVDDHVMPIHHVSEWQGVPYFIMPYTRGISLQKRLDHEGPLAIREILRIGIQTARGLAAAHAQGLVHRDIKPANILLDESVERVALVDFGLARAVDDVRLTHSGMLAGTPQYMSPEQARGETVEQQSDLFSLGSVLYAMCTGHAPFRAETSYGVLRRITDEEPRPIRHMNADIPEWFCQIVGKLMSKSAADRPDSAINVADLLQACLAHVQQPMAAPLPDSLGKPSTLRHGAAFSRFNSFGKGEFVMLGILTLGLLAAVLWQAGGLQAEKEEDAVSNSPAGVHAADEGRPTQLANDTSVDEGASSHGSVGGLASPPEPPERIEVEEERVSAALGSAARVVLVQDDSFWMHHRLPAVFDETAHRQLARAIVRSVEKDGPIKGDRITGEPTGVFVRYTDEGYEQHGQFIPHVIKQLEGPAKQRSEDRAAAKSYLLLGGDGKGANPDAGAAAKRVEVEEERVSAALGSAARLILVQDDSLWMHHKLPAVFDETAHRQLAKAIVRSVEKDGPIKGDRITGEPTGVFVRYTDKGYEQYGQFIPHVIKQLEGPAKQRAEDRAAAKSYLLLEGDGKGANPDAGAAARGAAAQDAALNRPQTTKDTANDKEDFPDAAQSVERYLKAKELAPGFHTQASQIDSLPSLFIKGQAGTRSDSSFDKITQWTESDFDLQSRLPTDELGLLVKTLQHSVVGSPLRGRAAAIARNLLWEASHTDLDEVKQKQAIQLAWTLLVASQTLREDMTLEQVVAVVGPPTYKNAFGDQVWVVGNQNGRPHLTAKFGGNGRTVSFVSNWQ